MTVIYDFESFSVDSERCELRDGNNLVAVEKRVFDLLVLLLRNSHRVVTKHEILREVWDSRQVSPGSLSVAMTDLRRALRDSAKQPRLILTHPGRGYRFIGHPVVRGASPHGSRGILSDARARLAGSIVGRDEACATIDSLLDRVRCGEFHLALVSGEAGIGKTRLLAETADRARVSGFVVIDGLTFDDEAISPLNVWARIIESLATTVAIPLSELADVLPELHWRYTAARDSQATTLALADRDTLERLRQRLNHVVSSLLLRISKRTPVLLTLDDLHRADQASLELLCHLATAGGSINLLIACAYRQVPARDSSVFRRSIERLIRSPYAQPIELYGLPAPAVSKLYEESTGSKPQANTIGELYAASAGNPLFLKHLIARRERDGGIVAEPSNHALGTDLIAAVASCLTDLPPDTLSSLQCASVIGSEFYLSDLAELIDTERDDLLSDLEPALDTGHVSSTSRSDRFRFSHAVVRRALYQQIPPLRRAQLHKRFADSLRSRTSSDHTASLGVLAHHYSQASAIGATNEAAHYCRAAADWAAGQGSYEQAATLYSQALDHYAATGRATPTLRCELLLRIGAQQLSAGARTDAIATLDQAARIAADVGRADALARAALALSPGVLSIETGVVDPTLIALLRSAISALGAGDSVLSAIVKARLSLALHWTDEASEPSELVEDALRSAQETGDSLLHLQASIAQWFHCHGPSARFSRKGRASEVVARATESRDVNSEFVGRLFLLGALLEEGSTAQFDVEVSRYEARASILRQPQLEWYVPMLRGARALMCGRIAEATELRDRFAMIGNLAGDVNAYHSALAHSLLLLHETGKLDTALPFVTNAVDRYPAVVGWRATRAWILARRGLCDAARRDVDYALERDRARVRERLDWHASMALSAEATSLTNDRAAASELYNRLAPLDGKFSVIGLCVLSWGAISRLLGLLAYCLGDLRRARMHLADAIRENRSSGAAAWEAQSALDLARVCAAEGTSEGLEIRSASLQSALQVADSAGLTRIAEASRKELARLL